MIWAIPACIAGVVLSLAILWFVGTVVEVAFDRQREDLRFFYTLHGSPIPAIVAVVIGVMSGIPAWLMVIAVPFISALVIAFIAGLFIVLKHGGQIWTALAESLGRRLREVVADWRFHRNIDR